MINRARLVAIYNETPESIERVCAILDSWNDSRTDKTKYYADFDKRYLSLDAAGIIAALEMKFKRNKRRAGAVAVKAKYGAHAAYMITGHSIQ